MGAFVSNLHVHGPPSLVRDLQALTALVQAALASKWRPADANETAERTVSVYLAGDEPWATLTENAGDLDPLGSIQLAEAITAQNSAVAGVVTLVADGSLCGLELCLGGHVVDHVMDRESAIAAFGSAPAGQRSPEWLKLLGSDRSAAVLDDQHLMNAFWKILGDRLEAGLDNDEPDAVLGFRPIGAPKSALGDVSAKDVGIPTALCGTAAEARRRLKAFCRRAVKAGNWAAALDGMPTVRPEDAPGEFVLAAYFGVPSGQNTFFTYVLPILEDACFRELRPERASELVRRLAIEGMDHFWFAVSILADDWYFPREGRPDELAALIRKALRWWTLCERHAPRFTDGLNDLRGWAGRILHYTARLGASEEELDRIRTMPAPEAAAAIEKLLVRLQ